MKVENKIRGDPLVYALSDPRNPKTPRYIGRTISHVRQRLYTHLVAAYNAPNEPIAKWLLELESLGLLPVVLIYELCTTETMKQREEFWIRFFRPSGWLLNKNNGSGPGFGRRPSEANIAATIARNKKGLSPESRQKQAASMRGRKWSEERRRKWMKSPRVLENTNRAIRMAKIISVANKKPVVCLETGREFSSVRECVKFLNGNQPWFNQTMKEGKPYKGLHYKLIEKQPKKELWHQQ